VRAGNRVELRTPAEILATLDEQGCLEGLPFMPEMFRFFGKSFTVEAQVARACDTLNYQGVRRLRDTVILDDLRCDGTGHAGCQAQCRLYWKEAWLRPAPSGEGRDAVISSDPDSFRRLQRLVTENVHAATSTHEEPTFRCQATELLRASEPVAWRSVRSLVHEVTGGNVGLWRFLRVAMRVALEKVGGRLRLASGSNHPFRPRELAGNYFVPPTPAGLRPGELVQIRSKAEIRETLSEKGKTRGLWFDREMLPYCGQTARVKTKVERFIDERSGKLVELASDAYILDNVVCQGYRSDGRWFCPRAIYPWWRECWLEPTEAVEAATDAATESPAS
jgi:hypothetical protein